MKIQVTQQQRDNALEALNVMWPSVPPENVAASLGYWREDNHPNSEPECGTVACFGGWCAWWPAFRAQGIVAFVDGSPTTKGKAPPSNVSLELFGSHKLFRTRGGSDVDFGFSGTDHELVSHRLRWLIENSEVVGPRRSRKTASGL